jgi:signal transduction histidine kinase
VRLALEAAAAPLDRPAPRCASSPDRSTKRCTTRTVLIRAIEDETREIGDHLDRRSADVAQFLVLLGLVSVATSAGMAWLLLRACCGRCANCAQAAIRLGRGELDTHVPVHHADELGDLALTFRAMAQKVRSSHAELERRVEERSREVLRTAHLAQLGTLAAGIAHEINNPLASIVAGTDGLLRELDRSAATTRRRATTCRSCARRRCGRATSRCACCASPARTSARREPVALAAELREVAAMFAHQLPTPA